LIGSREQVKIHKALLRAVARSRYPHYKVAMGAGTKAKTMTSLLILTGVVSKSVVKFSVNHD